MSRKVIFEFLFVCVFFARRFRKNYARVSHEMAQILKIADLSIAMEPTLHVWCITGKGNSYNLLKRLWVLFVS